MFVCFLVYGVVVYYEVWCALGGLGCLVVGFWVVLFVYVCLT